MLSYDRALHALRTWLDSWTGIGHVAVGMHRQGYDLQLTRYDEKGWRATFYTTGMEHSPASATGTGWERRQRRAVEGAARDALRARRSVRSRLRQPSGRQEPMNLVRAIAVLLCAFLLGACTTAKNTPQQDLVWSAYNRCKAEGRVPSNIQLDRVEPDGRAWYSAYRSTYGTQELEGCMKEKISTSKTAIPPAYPPVISR
jgi:hypothetical protein